ncbi:AraC family transcriptional regulator [Vibrio sp. V39_P1S14PM300]|uniref:AraC family transcriptional regulator n=1 Tax=Vibrio sp. V39_P1S14PM300 TaxID=1938690 RepID=UPI001373503D|nr:helix-turn-helix domain-containing protein [Vibrio sp. V39_P1S14PM300]NAX21639.1 helix-turn-helix domain-containing protein [Vibrio sp. V39_P1S14PM300]
MDFRLYQPQGRTADHIQGIWSVYVSSEHDEPIDKLLFGDAGSGVLFNFGADVFFADAWHAPGIVLLPVSLKAQTVILPAGTLMAGIRFHPAMGYQCLGKRFEQPVRSEQEPDIHTRLSPLYEQMRHCQGHNGRLRVLYQYAQQHFVHDGDERKQVVRLVQHAHSNPSAPATVGLRQIERHFQTWMGMTPKYYQRLIRVKQALEQLKHSPSTPLADLAADLGFADQAHMTREFRALANITPKHYARRCLHIGAPK